MSYLENLHPKETDPELVSLRMRAERDGVPIISGEGLRFLRQVLTLGGAKTILEIGTATAYSAIAMAKHAPGARITTVEREAELALEARRNIKEVGLDRRIEVIETDATTMDTSILESPFDLVFIDGAKSQSLTFFEKFAPLVRIGGVVVVDNLLFHGFVGDDAPRAKNRNTRQLVRKIDHFNRALLALDHYESAIHPIGDGMSLSIRRK
ncbi:MAG: O-methyltransferase [Candidatus Izemoplasmataceae bacterium]